MAYYCPQVARPVKNTREYTKIEYFSSFKLYSAPQNY